MFVYVIISSCIVAIVAANCSINPCLNGGTCNALHKNDTAQFYCRCPSGWKGRFCQAPFRYIGCFVDPEVRILPILLPRSNSNSPIECAARCRGYLYSGTEAGNYCFCGEYLIAMIRPDSECNSVCPGDSSKKCGAGARISVYSNIHCAPPH
ncbi:uncharacterized protein LOC127873625 [Dreissena polymorpha]|uniref:EGF-like domain-containing protein n=1 Tax=Dreissena polymorpha TaxID=45954 RepID=A0A9D4KWL8_DREPO|nr:uncharacterized protein LOC127873625 [Dreissena polymorpha]XP_052273473.1 uncharacterized protein LOC127873625 [Dreissena polymorpha]KAH3847492.1 hypothetical protein DPMN_089813 [Dreissena polymorpha]